MPGRCAQAQVGSLKGDCGGNRVGGDFPGYWSPVAGPEAEAAGTSRTGGPGAPSSEYSLLGAGIPNCSGTCSPGVQPRVAFWVMSAVSSARKCGGSHENVASELSMSEVRVRVRVRVRDRD